MVVYTQFSLRLLGGSAKVAEKLSSRVKKLGNLVRIEARTKCAYVQLIEF